MLRNGVWVCACMHMVPRLLFQRGDFGPRTAAPVSSAARSRSSFLRTGTEFCALDGCHDIITTFDATTQVACNDNRPARAKLLGCAAVAVTTAFILLALSTCSAAVRFPLRDTSSGATNGNHHSSTPRGPLKISEFHLVRDALLAARSGATSLH